ncbi:hypothetical protein [Ktedonobacter racemifer]|uniref:hypothetical protein n=1 Tax=Ktedonobacter racemifer TaxID=363277 RepID=UPI001FCAAF90|nr:hypothetical protein [Ktedonobacter racemifer]
MLTSREKPADLVPLEGKRSPGRALRLAGLDDLASAQILTEKEVVGSPQNLARLVEVYQGNPLALKIVAQTIVELFGGEVIPFLRRGGLWGGASTAGRAICPPLGARADRFGLAGHSARAGEPGGAPLRVGGPACASAAVGSRGWAAPAQSHRAGATGWQLYLAVGGAGVRDRLAGRHGQTGDRARQAPAVA